ncbi:hypothetical protein EMIT0111MI5_180047 [Burkholderia sp. IT-111MI5]
MRDLFRVPEDRQLDPACRVGRLAPRGAAPIGIACVEGECRRVFVLQEAGVEAHQADRHLEGRRRCDAGRAIALLDEHPAGGGIGDDGADRTGGCGGGGEEAGGKDKQRAAPGFQARLHRIVIGRCAVRAGRRIVSPGARSMGQVPRRRRLPEPTV